MKVFTGKDLFDSFSGISKSFDDLNHLARGEQHCKRCNGTGWCGPGKWQLFRLWLSAFPFRLRFKPNPANDKPNEDAPPAGGNA